MARTPDTREQAAPPRAERGHRAVARSERRAAAAQGRARHRREADDQGPAGHCRRVRLRPDAGAARRDPVRLGLGPRLARRRDRRGLLLGLRARHHRRLPPVLHAQLVQGQAGPAGRAGDRGQPGDGGTGRHLGSRPPAAPQVQRQGGRPALALAVRRRRQGTRQGPGLGARALAVRPEPDLAGEVRARPARRPEDPHGRRLVPRTRRVLAPCPGADRRLLDLAGVCPGTAPSRRSSGPAWSASRCCTT